ncbi:MAG: hypothetical protein ACMG6E_02540 [Candidatus Roizmanbacteria bacterium]
MKNTAVIVWNTARKISEKKGSSPGGIYELSSGEKYYVKFSGQESDDRIWNEYLAEEVYKTLKIAIPETIMVSINGEIGHASKFLEENGHLDLNELKHGFVADCLLANWDIVSHLGDEARNVLMHDSVLYRIDNGGALLFRARGERKINEAFNGTVAELETMKGSYPGLTEMDILSQSEMLKMVLTDQKIDELVESVNLIDEDGLYLKDILKRRRDFTLLA